MTDQANPSAHFVRALEALYAEAVDQYESGGMDPSTARLNAFQDVKDFGRASLEEMRRRGLLPCRIAENEVNPTSGDSMNARRVAGAAVVP